MDSFLITHLESAPKPDKDQVVNQSFGIEVPPAEPPDPSTLCPRCSTKLINPADLGWCSKCGYCRSLTQNVPKQVEVRQTAQQPSMLGAAEFLEVLAKMPTWVKILCGGVGIITVVSIMANYAFPAYSITRAIWSSVIVFFGLVGLFVAQIWALIMIAPEEDTLGAKDVFLAGKLWKFTLRRLPGTRRPVWLASWSVSAGLLAVFLTGGFSYWYQYYRPKKLADRNLMAAAMDALKEKDTKDESLTESVEDLAGKQDLTKDKKKENDDPKSDRRPVIHCAVIGYIMKDDDLNGLVLAAEEEGQLFYAGTVRRGFSDEDKKELLAQLSKLVRSDPIIKGMNINAIWVTPGVFCEVHFSPPDKSGRFTDLNFAALLER